MNVATLFRGASQDVREMLPVLNEVFPKTLPPEYHDVKMPMGKFVGLLNRQLAPYGLFVELRKSRKVSPGEYSVSGLWYYPGSLPAAGSMADVRVLLLLHPNSRCLEFSQDGWETFRMTFFAFLMHELIHRHQERHLSDTRNKNRVYLPRTTERALREEREYYGSCDEIEAYAHDAAVELLSHWPDAPYAEMSAQAITQKDEIRTTYAIYVDLFSDTPKHPALRHFKRKMKTWYNLVVTQLPFYRELGLV